MPQGLGVCWPRSFGALKSAPGACQVAIRVGPPQWEERPLTALSIPRVSSMMKNTAAQAEDSGSVASASG